MCKTFYRFFIVMLIAAMIPGAASAQTPPAQTGIVIMHGKGGSPKKFVAELASSLEAAGYLVANLEMPWSGARNYDVSVSDGVKEVENALAMLRSKGAQHVFVAGHSQGGLFALYLAGKVPMDGVIAIAPGGSVSSNIFREKLGKYVDQAHAMIAEGKGEEKTEFFDFESSRGTNPIVTTPDNYISWFDPKGAMNEFNAASNVNPDVPVLFIGPTRDYPGLVKIKQKVFDMLPKNPLTKLYEPDSSHLQAPSASQEEIVRWIDEVLIAKKH